MFSYLPPDQAALRRRYQPDLNNLLSHQDNPVTLEWLSRMHAAVSDAQARASESTTQEELNERRGFLRGLVSSLELVETVAAEVKSGELAAQDDVVAQPV